jgi:HEPN domain-containing protein
MVQEGFWTMNRLDFQRLSELRLREAKALLVAGFPEGAYYLAGYSVECALKACIAKRTREHDFPEKDSSNFYVHDLEKLLGHAKLKSEFDLALRDNPAMNTNWIAAKDWSEKSRYDRKTVEEATGLLMAIEDQNGGLLQWVQKHW